MGRHQRTRTRPRRAWAGGVGTGRWVRVAAAIIGEVRRQGEGAPAIMGGDWRVCIGFGGLPRSLDSFRRVLIVHLESRLGDQVAVGSNAAEIFVYAPSAGLADEAADVARGLLAWRDLSASVRTEGWSPRYQRWWDAAKMPADPVAERQALHEARQERERQASATFGRPAREVWVKLSSHDDVVHLAEHLSAQGWRVRAHRRHLVVGADCEDDAKSLARELCGDGRADADAAFRVRRVDIYASWADGGTGGGGP